MFLIPVSSSGDLLGRGPLKSACCGGLERRALQRITAANRATPLPGRDARLLSSAHVHIMKMSGRVARRTWGNPGNFRRQFLHMAAGLPRCGMSWIATAQT